DGGRQVVVLDSKSLSFDGEVHTSQFITVSSTLSIIVATIGLTHENLINYLGSAIRLTSTQRLGFATYACQMRSPHQDNRAIIQTECLPAGTTPLTLI